jgi:cell division protein FtsI/penicillin-binding protein 2
MKKRIFLSLISIVFFIFIITGKLFWIQVVESHSFSARNINLVQHSVIQRAKGVTLDEGRADFYDRHVDPLTGTEVQVLAVFPVNLPYTQEQERLKILVDELDISLEKWNQYIHQLKEPQLWKGLSDSPIPIRLTPKQAETITSLHLQNVYVVPYKLRYSEPYLASHLVGFIGQNPKRLEEEYRELINKGLLTTKSKMGAGGLERTLDRFLQSVEKTTLSLFIDGKNKPLDGLSIRMNSPTNPFYPLKAITTLDKGIQTKIEAAVDQMNIQNGAVVVLDADNADIVTMVSRPHFDPNQINLLAGNWGNKSLKAAVPGSVFKTVVAAAALEGGWINERELFQCNGSLGKYGLSCWKEGGHGRITLEQAFAQSCNVTFATLIERIPSSQLEDVGRKLGLQQQIGWSSDTWASGHDLVQLDAEEIGKIFDPETPKSDGGVRAQTSIGQRDVMLTPLQAANLMVTLLHDGEVKSPRAVKELRFHNDRLFLPFHEKVLIPKGKGVSRRTARTLLHWMEHVVSDGTGQALKKTEWKLAGKTGTAQANLNGEISENQWFVGYGPTDHPKYAVAVLVQTKGQGQPHQATNLFREVMNLLAKS